MEQVWKIVTVKSGNCEQVVSPIDVIQDKKVLLLSAIVNSGYSLTSLLV